ncbi:hypothetical protein [Rhizomonospora bruguierae]|uniref:hypothetical protein n=1 Tax=Rhizomonospora bruguierae TaxID=1581705 RepID=UPI001BCFC1C2|nr:hypothetical protein [Micromonospora sp. NBRC 107566]
MRRLMAAALFAALALTAAGCGTDSTPSANSSASPGPDANTQQVCADARKVITDSSAAFSKQMAQIAVAAATGRGEPEKTAVTELKRLITDWSTGLKEQAGKAVDPALKEALSDMSDGFATAGAKFKSFKDTEKATEYMDSPQIQAASQKLESICG